MEIDCEEEHFFLCNYPTPSPTTVPTKTPTYPPTHNVHSQNIIITNHVNICSDWIAFKLDHVDLSCGG